MYQVLYRKWRPQVFSDVVGQEHITDTLMGAVENNRVSHAYLFTGSRGTGKTTCAKILAKAVNCEHPINGNPCNECAACKGIDDGSVVDVVEIDAASNNGVDNIRDLREETNYMPSSVKYRVYIIDEVHMLSTGAFNALLKTLEEPPEHVKFILATTEVHKLPATILSRCQRFDFRRIAPDDIVKRLKYVAEQENINLTDDGAMLIARVSDGGMRDALSLLDRCSSFGSDITEEVASEAAGIAGKEHIYALVNAINSHDCEAALKIINSLYQNSCDMERMFSELISHLRNMMVALTVPDYKSLILACESETQKIKIQAQEMTLETILSAMSILNSAVADLKRGADKRITAEMTIIRLTSPSLDSDNQALLRRISELERKIENGNFTQKPVSQTKPIQPVTEKAEAVSAQNNIEKITETTVDKTTAANTSNEVVKPTVNNNNIQKSENTNIPMSQQIKTENPPVAQSSADDNSGEITQFRKWVDVLEIVGKTDPMIVGFMNNSQAFIRNDTLLIKPANPILPQFLNQQEHQNIIEDAIESITGTRYKIGVYKKAEAQNESSGTLPSKSPLDSLLERARGLDIQIIEQ